MPDLSEDIISLVLKDVYYLHDAGLQLEHTPNRTLLRSCALVNSIWSRPAQALLFRNVILNPKFVETFLGDEGPLDESCAALLEHVRIATTLPWNPSNDIDDLGRTIAKCLERCTALYELGIYAGGPISFCQSIVDDLNRVVQARTTPLRALRIYECGVLSRVVEQLITTLPTLEFLVIDCEVGLPPKEGAECKAQLYELRLTRNLRTEFLEWLLQASKGSLQILELRDLPGRTTRDILRPYCDTIRSLRLMPFNQISAEIVTMCTQLEELRLMGIPNVFPLPKVLPSTLHHLEIVLMTVVTERTRLRPITEVVKSHAGLRLLTIRTSSLVETVVDFAALEEACREHGVKLDIDKAGFWPLETLVKTRSFPRRRSVSNFNRMN
ncbi:hypothetical protein NMY22_g8519 [Coprinellus aureogranulatus]|nr:hypothetical protein NMY22_g8519 [Coprinellus aureogranulatus]